MDKSLFSGLKSVKKVLIDEKKNIHCENLIGAVSLPLGVAGPLIIKSQITNNKSQKKQHYVPLATTEGALVASVNRGCKAVRLSGGISVFCDNVGVTRGPVFETSGIRESRRLKKWLTENFFLIKKTSELTSSHLKLIKIETKVIGRYIYVRFSYDTGEAMGMNMVTLATQAIIELIEKKTKIRCLSIAGNFDIDKKPAWLNSFQGRGKTVLAEIIIPKDIVKTVLKTTSQKIFDLWLGKNILGSVISGSLGYNAHFANIVAAFYAATGQDLAHTVEGSLGISIVKVLVNGDLYFSVYLPAIMVGMVGGGTRLMTQTEARNITKAKNAEELAEVLGGAVLAGELSLLASLAEGSLAKAHKKLGR
jgi:hydroxymethylglutaryl-CoA reductase (NADPH)